METIASTSYGKSLSDDDPTVVRVAASHLVVGLTRVIRSALAVSPRGRSVVGTSRKERSLPAWSVVSTQSGHGNASSPHSL